MTGANHKAPSPTSTLGGKHMRTESAGVDTGLSSRMNIGKGAGEPPITDEGHNGFKTERHAQRPRTSAKSKGKTFTVEG